MPAYIVLTVLFAALLHALWNIIVNGGENKLFETGLNALGAGLGAVCIVPFLPPLLPEAWPYLAMSCICHFTYYICIAEAYKKTDLSFSYTIMRGCAPLLTSLAMLFFGVSLSLGAWCGVLLLSSWMAQQGIDEGTLLPLLPEWLASPYEVRQDEIHAVFRGGRFLKPQTRAFIDFLVEAIRPLQGPR